MLVTLGRYAPGKIWSVAGLMVLAQRAGVDAWAAAASAVVIQALGIGTAVVVVAAATPSAEPPWRLAAAAAAGAGAVGPLAWDRAAGVFVLPMGTAAHVRALARAAAGRGGGVTPV